MAKVTMYVPATVWLYISIAPRLHVFWEQVRVRYGSGSAVEKRSHVHSSISCAALACMYT